jgi:hypothetical protein
MYVCMYICVYVCVYVCIFVRMYICMCLPVHIPGPFDLVSVTEIGSRAKTMCSPTIKR